MNDIREELIKSLEEIPPKFNYTIAINTELLREYGGTISLFIKADSIKGRLDLKCKFYGMRRIRWVTSDIQDLEFLKPLIEEVVSTLDDFCKENKTSLDLSKLRVGNIVHKCSISNLAIKGGDRVTLFLNVGRNAGGYTGLSITGTATFSGTIVFDEAETSLFSLLFSKLYTDDIPLMGAKLASGVKAIDRFKRRHRGHLVLTELYDSLKSNLELPSSSVYHLPIVDVTNIGVYTKGKTGGLQLVSRLIGLCEETNTFFDAIELFKGVKGQPNITSKTAELYIQYLKILTEYVENRYKA